MKNYTTVTDLYNGFLLEQKFRNNSEKTLNYYMENLNNFFKWLNSDDIEDLNLDNWKLYGVYLREIVVKRNGDNLSESSVQGAMRAIKAFYNYGIEQQILPDISRKLKLPKAHYREERILDDEEIDHLISCLSSPTHTGLRNKCFIFLMLDCGLRRGEIPKINIGHLDIKSRTMIINGKGGKQRVVPMGETSAALLNDYIEKYRKGSGLNDPLFLDDYGGRCTDNLVKQVFRRIKEKTGINRLHPHLLRHTFATYYIADGGDLETLRIILGHANIQTTQRYLHMAANLKLQRSRHNSHLDIIYEERRTKLK